MTVDDPRDISDKMKSFIAAGNLDGFASLFAPAAIVWHSATRRVVSVTEAVAVIKRIKDRMPDLHYEDVRLSPTVDGFVQQHMLCGTSPNGSQLTLPVCLVVKVDEQLISRLDEYIDRTAAAQLLGRSHTDHLSPPSSLR